MLKKVVLSIEMPLEGLNLTALGGVIDHPGYSWHRWPFCLYSCLVVAFVLAMVFIFIVLAIVPLQPAV